MKKKDSYTALAEAIGLCSKRLSTQSTNEQAAPPQPETKTGTCGVCGGEVKGEYVYGLNPGVDAARVPIGHGSKGCYGWQFQGYHCTTCGICYKFIVTKKPSSLLTTSTEL